MSQTAHRAALISVSLAHSRTPAYTARPRIQGRVKLLSAAGSKKVFAISKWRMVSNVRISLITVSTKKRLDTTTI